MKMEDHTMATMNHYPKIGIRPTIDGRRDAMKLYESLEEQTMDATMTVEVC